MDLVDDNLDAMESKMEKSNASITPDMEHLIQLFVSARDNSVALALAHNAMNEFLGAEAAQARASVAEAVALNVLARTPKAPG